ncbi:MAG: response regulator [Candidatus Abyssobacteria bacterium SURF_5]|uniref:Response regulator n=1 Tax=Abyssobacteria bacterium (strain SURF_5) TaxID=2093360 RepID=A0A3A4N723_ABYX5|nr:MAG: response regulator [Candidatus Abyssubacteria bacterium SURF_5]
MPTIDVLLVEDDAMQRRQLVRVLKSEGYQISESSTVEEAIRILGAERIDLVVTDKFMPDRDGLSLLEHVRLHHPGVPVIIMTGHAEEEMHPEPDALLIKPFSSEELKKIVRSLIQLS